MLFGILGLLPEIRQLELKLAPVWSSTIDPIILPNLKKLEIQTLRDIFSLFNFRDRRLSKLAMSLRLSWELPSRYPGWNFEADAPHASSEWFPQLRQLNFIHWRVFLNDSRSLRHGGAYTILPSARSYRHHRIGAQSN